MMKKNECGWSERLGFNRSSWRIVSNGLSSVGVFIALFALSVHTASECFASEIGYATESRLFKNAIDPALIAAGLCHSAVECSKENYAKFSVQGNSISISVYKIRTIDVAADLARRVLADLAETKNPPMPKTIAIYIFRDEFNPSVFVGKKKPIVQLVISGE